MLIRVEMMLEKSNGCDINKKAAATPTWTANSHDQAPGAKTSGANDLLSAFHPPLLALLLCMYSTVRPS